MKTYRVLQKAEIWYVTVVEAKNEEKAMKLAKDENNSDWEPDFETATFFEEYEVYED